MKPCDDSDDATLALRARDGSSAAFGQLVHRHHERVFGFLLALTRHREDAEDLTQETFLRAWKKIHRYDPTLPMLPWLLTMARRLSIAALRRKRPLPEMPVEEPAVSNNHAARLWEIAKRQLAPIAYQALWLHYREELPLKQVADVLGKREGAVKVILHRARKTLSESARAPEAMPDHLPQPELPMP